MLSMAEKINAILALASWELALASSTCGLVNIPAIVSRQYRPMVELLAMIEA